MNDQLIHFRCPLCHQKVLAPPASVGKKARCVCRAILLVPTGSGEPIARVADLPPNSTGPGQSREFDAVKKVLVAQTQDKQAADQLLTEAQKQLDEKSRVYDDLLQKHNEVLANYNRLLGDSQRRGAMDGVAGDEIRFVISLLLPRIRFVANSVDTFLSHGRDFREILTLLYQLNAGEKVPTKDFRAVPNWSEVNRRIGDGHRDQLRVYFRLLRSLDKVEVCVSTKQEQEKDVERLQRA